MKRVSPIRSTLAVLVIAAAAMSALGCSKKLTVDSGFTPEGVLSPDAALIVYQDIGVTVYAKHEFPPNSGVFLLDSTFTAYHFGPGTIEGMVLDGTAASGYQILRRQSGGGFAPLKDFMLTPVVRWPQSHWEAYAFHDQPSTGSLPPTYQGRGVFSGDITRNSPLTNTAQLNASSVADIRITAPFLFTAKGDTLPVVTWQAVPGAATYRIQTYQYRGDIRVGSEKFVYGIPAPFAVGKLHDFFLAEVPAPTTSYRLGSAGARIFQNVPMIGQQFYFFRVSAEDSMGRLVACSVGSRADTVRIGGEAFLYSPGAEVICVGCGSP